MGLEQARQDITAAVEALKYGGPINPVVIEYDNRKVVDTQIQVNPYMVVNYVFMDGWQADMAVHPIQRTIGQIHLAVVAKEGSGSALALKMLDYIYPRLQGKRLGIVRTKFAKPSRAVTKAGWVYYPVLIPFWFDEIPMV